MTHSTAGEDDAIVRYFDGVGVKTGRFLDIGAANGITLSNTHLLAQRGWSGVCIDANAQELFNLNNLYWDNPKVEIVQGLICDGHGLREFWNAKEANTSTSSRRMQERGRGRVGARQCWVAGFSLDDVWNAFGSDFDFISIDLEDGSVPIMRQLPKRVLDVAKAICVEHLRADLYFGEDEETQITKWGVEKGFKVMMRTDENVLMVKPC